MYKLFRIFRFYRYYRLSKEEINNFIKEADPKNEGTFEYKNFSKLIIKMGK